VGITDNDNTESFMAIDFETWSVAEDAGALQIGVSRWADGTNTVSVDFFTSDATATNGVDYTGITNTLTFGPLERQKFVSVPIINNKIKQGNRTFHLNLTNAVGALLWPVPYATVTIVDNDQGFAFEAASYSVLEDAGLALINVLRGTDDTNSTVTVDVATSDLTATSGSDYLGLTNMLTFAPGERIKQIVIPILNDEIKEPTKSFRVTLSNPGGGAVLSAKTIATVSIIDNDTGVSFEFASYSVWENAGMLSINVLRGNDVALGPITVDYAATNGTALAGRDYQSISGTLSFQQSETIKSISVPILRNTATSNNTSFGLTLNNPTGGALLGLSSTSVVISNASEAGAFRTVAPPYDTALSIRRTGEMSMISWAGGGRLQRADNPLGPWQTLLTATNPCTVQSPVQVSLYRVTRPRPVNIYVPSTYNGTNAMPLVIFLHAYGVTGVGQEENYVRFRPWAETRGFLYCYPESNIDLDGKPFWNVTDQPCCAGYYPGIDDVGYLRSLIEEIGRQFSVDRKRIHLIGHSNGGFMAYRMACDSADLIAGIASLAGSTFLDPSRCRPSQPVNILHIQGTADEKVAYYGDAWGPGSHSVEIWANYNGASGPVTDLAPTMNLDLDVGGLDTVITRYTNAPPGGAVELWTINGGHHTPTLNSGSVASEFAPRVIDWLLAHPKP
jgi:polyhydroxybutyrate depolymerase